MTASGDTRFLTSTGWSMNNPLLTSFVRRVPRGSGERFRRTLGFLFILLLLTLCSGCGDRTAVQVILQSKPAAKGSSLRLEIQGSVTGPLTGLHYKWLAVSGQCEPQESDVPVTVFRFAEGVKRDRVTLEVWRAGRRVSQSELAVTFAGEVAELAAKEKEPEVQIEITGIPPWEAGGEDTRANISGRVRGAIRPEYRVVLYALAYDSWYMQPTAHDLHPIQADNTWASWTHTGEQYAALVVSPGFVPRVRSDMLPVVGDKVLAKVIVEGIKAEKR